MNPTHPDSPEAVALELMRMIEAAEPKEGRRRGNLPERERLLGLYAACLGVVTGRHGAPPSLELVH